ncbi:alpha/beta hydrolase [Simiduia curdlanivorans]|uniref:Alpha/beta fold hydrolase n=1 Tax=Simiduia curdlanivorans TaxID=1492769 RepID=A0ABV8V2X9_9GAMM|nr:alpha/beta hydrolase [Simiduia curdlanivorans]MDN3637536.1 alpha/beta hydrolase [Simiduia curdlanivorans]
MSKIRPLINDVATERLIADRERVALLTSDIEIDIHRINEAIENKDLSADELEKILNLLEEPFLIGIDLPDQSIFQRWLESERHEINKMYCRVIAKLSLHASLTQIEKLKWQKIWLDKDPYNTKAARVLLNQLKSLNELSAFEKTSEELATRFRNAGICWPIKNSQSIENTTDEESQKPSTHEILSRQKIKFCSTQDGVRIAYASVGEGYPIVKAANWLSHLEHDWDAPIWSPLFRDLATDHHFLRYDERGNGLSDWDVKDISFNAFVEDLETVVATSKLEKFALLGISQGASVSIEYAIKHPEKVSHLILFGGYAAGWRIDSSEEQMREREAILTLTEVGWGQSNPAYRQIFSSTFLPNAKKSELDWFNEFQRLTTSPENAVRFLSAFGDIDVREQLAKISVPTLVIHSLGDQRIPVSVGRDIASRIPNAEFVGLESEGHLLLGREPAAKIFVDTIREFIAKNS